MRNRVSSVSRGVSRANTHELLTRLSQFSQHTKTITSEIFSTVRVYKLVRMSRRISFMGRNASPCDKRQMLITYLYLHFRYNDCRVSADHRPCVTIANTFGNAKLSLASDPISKMIRVTHTRWTRATRCGNIPPMLNPRCTPNCSPPSYSRAMPEIFSEYTAT